MRSKVRRVWSGTDYQAKVFMGIHLGSVMTIARGTFCVEAQLIAFQSASLRYKNAQIKQALLRNVQRIT